VSGEHDESKPVLRSRFQQRLASLDAGTARTAAHRAADSLLALPEVARARRIFACLSFGNEIDTLALVDTLLADGRELFVPRADARDGAIHVHPYPCPLVTLPFGLRQPPRGAPELPQVEVDGALDVAIVLGLAFDRRGVRLGYGRGYFDRFLAGRPFPAIGFAYAAQVVDRLPAEPHDVPMTAVVSEFEVVRPAV
jgi:5-formyltetrahydrofolate cyclo-ligase